MRSLVRWQPFQELSNLQRQMNRWFEPFAERTSLVPFEEGITSMEFGPPVDIIEDDQKLTFKVEVPGIEEKDIHVEVENNVLTVRGERRIEKDVKEENFRRMERRYGAFARSFTLPPSVDAEKIDANYNNGVLAIQIAKRAEAKPKQVKVNVTKSLKAA